VFFIKTFYLFVTKLNYIRLHYKSITNMNQSEFVKIITPFKDKLFRLAKRMLVSTEEAEDATQEVLVRLWNKNSSLEQYNSVEALAMTMTKNYCLDQLKSKRATNLQIVHNNYQDRQASVDTQIEHQNTLQWAEKLMNDLPEQQRLILQLREIEEYEFSEIAQVLEMNETAVRVALSRARKTLREQIEKTHNYGTQVS
jgi:RNA polymerase sigma-70 factor (ECF subfamily)